LANIKSAIKRNKQNEKRRISNRIYRGRARTFIQRSRVLILAEEKDKLNRPLKKQFVHWILQLPKALFTKTMQPDEKAA